MEDHNKKQKSLVESLMAYMMKHHYEDYMNLKYDVLINTSESVIRKNYGPLGEGVFTDVITFFEEREEYEKCQALIDLRKKILNKEKKVH